MDKKESLRRIELNNLATMAVVTLAIGLIALCFYLAQGGKYFISFSEDSNVDYKVKLKDNEFYEQQYLGKDTGYVVDLIENISTDFDYDLKFTSNVSYKYSYKIVADVEVVDNNVNSNIYHYNEVLKEKELSIAEGNLSIAEKIDIDYQKYNNFITKFRNVYELNRTTSTLKVYMIVNVQDIDKTTTNIFMDKKVASLEIPLTEKTVTVDLGNNIVNNTDRVELSRHANYTWLLIISVFYLIISVVYFIYLIIYYMRTRTAQMVYDKEIKSILNNYDSYIQRINGTYDIGTSQVLRIETFNDMLEIRDTLKQPILMLENEAKDGTFFIIPATNSIIYTYALRVVDIKAKMDGKEVPMYDITEIAHKDFMKNKKYTDKYIKEQITMTTAMPIVDDKNVIKGSNDKSTSLYDQLEMTQSFDINEIRKAEKELKKKTKSTKAKTTKGSKTKKKK